MSWAGRQITYIPFRLTAAEHEMNPATVSRNEVFMSYPALVPWLAIHCHILHIGTVLKSRGGNLKCLVTVHRYGEVAEPR